MMKRFMIMAVMLIGLGVTAFAQSEKLGIGLNVGYGSEISKPSIGVKALYNITEEFTIAPSFNYYFPEKKRIESVETKLKYWDLNCDVHWNLFNKENYLLYPFAGLAYAHVKGEASEDEWGFSYDESGGDFGLNLGFGGQMFLTENLLGTAEVKYQIISGLNQFVPSISLIYKF